MRRAAVALVSTVVLGVSVFGAATAVGAQSAPGARLTPGTSTAYYTVRPLCGDKASIAAVHCLGLKRVRASARTPGATKVTTRSDLTYGPAGGYTPDNLAKAYGVDPNASVHQTVAVVDAHHDPNIRADLNTFDAQYGLPAETSTSLRVVSQTGSSTARPVDDADSADPGWSAEESTDVEAVRALCHKCRILVVEAGQVGAANTRVSFLDFATAENTAARLGANEIANSWGYDEGYSTNTTFVRNAFNHPGVVITAATGDDGMYSWDFVNESGGGGNAQDYVSSEVPSFPASAPTVVAVGGTTLHLNGNGTRSSETVWNSNGPNDSAGLASGQAEGATGGGCSSNFTAQPWQYSVRNYAQTGCGHKRLPADVSADADPMTGFDAYDSYQVPGVNTCTPPNCWTTVGGTSLSAPLIAAMWALAGGAHGAKYPSLWLYGHARSAWGSIYDVRTGGNGLCGGTSRSSCAAAIGGPPNDAVLPDGKTPAGTLDCAWKPDSATPSVGTRACDAAQGYDGPSGVGTPNGTGLFTPMYPSPHISVPRSISHGHSASFTGVGSSDPFPGGRITSYRWTWGDGSAAAGGYRPTHTYRTAGTYRVRVTGTDNYGQSATRQVYVHVR